MSQTIIPSPYMDSQCGPQKYEQIECISPGFRLGGIQHKRREGSIKCTSLSKTSSGCSVLTHSHSIWLVVSIPLKNMKVSWDDHSQYGTIQHVPNHQPAIKHLTSQDFESESVSAFKEGTICVSVNL